MNDPDRPPIVPDEASAVGGPPAPPPDGPPTDPEAVPFPPPVPVNPRRLVHPLEPSRFALSLVAAALPVGLGFFVLISLGRIAALLAFFLVLAFLLAMVWLVLQVWRIKLLGDAVLVTRHTLPEVQQVLDVVHDRLDYRRRLDVFVVDRTSRVLSAEAAPVALTSFFGINVLVVEGEALGELDSESDRRQLVFTLATYVGALKARHSHWWTTMVLVLQATGLTAFLSLFIIPWHRATVYSGDRTAFACCGDLDVSLSAVYRTMVGRSVSPYLRAEGLTAQALDVRRRRLLRLVQLLRPTPHATNRYLELVAFMQRETPTAFEDRRAILGVTPDTERVLSRLSGRRSRTWTVPLAGFIALVLALTGFVAGVRAYDSELARELLENVFGSEETGPPGGPGPDGPGETTATGSTAATILQKQVPKGMTSCKGPESVRSGSALLLLCTGKTPDGIDSFAVFSFWKEAEMLDALRENNGGDLPKADCSTGASGSGTWTVDGVAAGPMTCHQGGNGRATIAWASTSTLLLAVATSSTLTRKQLYDWWVTNGSPLS